MAELITVARPYAEAVFKLASETNSLLAWSEVLAVLSALAQESTVAEYVANPKYSSEQVKQLLDDVLVKMANPQVSNFVSAILENRRFAVLPQVALLFEEMRAKAEGSVNACIESAFELNGAQIDELKALLTARIGKRVDATVSVDPDLIGGVRMTIGDDVIDASVRGKLAALSVRLTS